MGRPTKDPLWEVIVEKTDGNHYRATSDGNPEGDPYFHKFLDASRAAKKLSKDDDVKRVYIVERRIIEEYNGPTAVKDPKAVPLDDRLESE